VSWSAVLSGTLVSIVIYGLIATSIVQAGDGNNSQAGWVAVGAAALVPLLMFLLAFLTRTDGPLRTAAITSSAVLVVFVAGSFIARDIASGYVLAIGLGAAYAMRLDEAKHDRKWRLYTAVGLAVYTKLVFFISPSIAVAAAPMLPVLGISIVDSVIERRRTG
jgi:4-amino-4-deoxy-L-arabinose transferase-like glycosyltransferase